MIDFEFFEHNGVMTTAELSQDGGSHVAALANNPEVRGVGSTREEAIARLKQRLAGAAGGTAVAVQEVPATPARAKAGLRRLGRPGRVLVVEDNPQAMQLVMVVCQLCGHATVGARDGREAWQQLEAGPVDLVLTDLHMPGVGGLALVRAMRARRPEVPILAVTAAGPNGVRLLQELGVDGVVRKPFAIQQLADAIRGLIVPA